VKVTSLEQDNWHALYLIGDIQRQIGLYDASVDTFDKLLRARPDELVITVALAETLLQLGLAQVRTGLTKRAIGTLIECLSLSSDLVEGESAKRIAWKLVGDGLMKLGELVQVTDGEIVKPLLNGFLEKLDAEDVDAKNSLLSIVTVAHLQQNIHDLNSDVACLAVGVLSYSIRMLLDAEVADAAGPAWFDLGHALHRVKPHMQIFDPSAEKPDKEVNLQSIQCLRNALQKEPLNGQFWNLLGVLATDATPKLAQHALIRACELNVRVSDFGGLRRSWDSADACLVGIERCSVDQSRTLLRQARRLRTRQQSFLARSSVGSRLSGSMAWTGCIGQTLR
jgi:superkiller protein 3